MTSIDSAISSLLSAQQSAVSDQVAFAVAAKSLDAQKQVGKAMAELVTSAANTAKAIDRGHHFNKLA